MGRQYTFTWKGRLCILNIHIQRFPNDKSELKSYSHSWAMTKIFKLLASHQSTCVYEEMYITKHCCLVNFKNTKFLLHNWRGLKFYIQTEITNHLWNPIAVSVKLIKTRLRVINICKLVLLPLIKAATVVYSLWVRLSGFLL